MSQGILCTAYRKLRVLVELYIMAVIICHAFPERMFPINTIYNGQGLTSPAHHLAVLFGTCVCQHIELSKLGCIQMQDSFVPTTNLDTFPYVLQTTVLSELSLWKGFCQSFMELKWLHISENMTCTLFPTCSKSNLQHFNTQEKGHYLF